MHFNLTFIGSFSGTYPRHIKMTDLKGVCDDEFGLDALKDYFDSLGPDSRRSLDLDRINLDDQHIWIEDKHMLWQVCSYLPYQSADYDALWFVNY